MIFEFNLDGGPFITGLVTALVTVLDWTSCPAGRREFLIQQDFLRGDTSSQQEILTHSLRSGRSFSDHMATAMVLIFLPQIRFDVLVCFYDAGHVLASPTIRIRVIRKLWRLLFFDISGRYTVTCSQSYSLWSFQEGFSSSFFHGFFFRYAKTFFFRPFFVSRKMHVLKLTSNHFLLSGVLF